MLRLTLSGEEWRSLRVLAAEGDTSMQALVAAMVQREVVQHIRTRAMGRVRSRASKTEGST
jgi:hypothetical protein